MPLHNAGVTVGTGVSRLVSNTSLRVSRLVTSGSRSKMESQIISRLTPENDIGKEILASLIISRIPLIIVYFVLVLFLF